MVAGGPGRVNNEPTLTSWDSGDRRRDEGDNRRAYRKVGVRDGGGCGRWKGAGRSRPPPLEAPEPAAWGLLDGSSAAAAVSGCNGSTQDFVDCRVRASPQDWRGCRLEDQRGGRRAHVGRNVRAGPAVHASQESPKREMTAFGRVSSVAPPDDPVSTRKSESPGL